MQKEQYAALRTARDAAAVEHQPIIRWSMKYIDRLEKKLKEAYTLVSVLKRTVSMQDIDED